MDRYELEKIRSLLIQIDQLTQDLEGLLSEHGLSELADEIRRRLTLIREEAERLTWDDFLQALARVNFEDREYRLLRVNDGDTLEVLPPDELKSWMRDVHIRLYGVDAPESSTELGPI